MRLSLEAEEKLLGTGWGVSVGHEACVNLKRGSSGCSKLYHKSNDCKKKKRKKEKSNDCHILANSLSKLGPKPFPHKALFSLNLPEKEVGWFLFSREGGYGTERLRFLLMSA